MNRWKITVIAVVIAFVVVSLLAVVVVRRYPRHVKVEAKVLSVYYAKEGETWVTRLELPNGRVVHVNTKVGEVGEKVELELHERWLECE